MSIVLSDDEARVNITANVKRLMLERDISQADLARVTDESEMRISKMVRGMHLPTAGFLARIAEALGVSANDLLKPSSKKFQKAS